MCRGTLSVTGHRRVPPEPLYTRILLRTIYLGQHGKGKGANGDGNRARRGALRGSRREMGKVYRWCPANVLIECTCGEESTLSAFITTCGECGKDHVPIVEEMLEARPEDKGDHPWRYLQPYTPMRCA